MLKNDIMSVAGSPESANTNKCATILKTVLRKRKQKSLPSMRKNQDFDSLSSPNNESNATKINSGLTLKRVYNVEKAEVVDPDFMKKVKSDLKTKAIDKKFHNPPEKAPNREQRKISSKRGEPYNPQTKNPVKSKNRIQKRKEKLRMEERQSIEEKLRSVEKQRSEEKQRIEEKQRNEEKQRRDEKQRWEEKKMEEKRRILERQRRRIEERPFDESQRSQEDMQSSSNRRKSLENRITTKIWQILAQDVFLLDHDKFSSQIQATNSETKNYIVSVIKKCNHKELKKQNPTKVIQTSRESLSSYRAGKKALKCAVRRRIWKLTKLSLKRSKHWSQFLAENNIILENINIDKFDLSLIDLDALGIENKMLKRAITWLFN